MQWFRLSDWPKTEKQYQQSVHHLRVTNFISIPFIVSTIFAWRISFESKIKTFTHAQALEIELDAREACRENERKLTKLELCAR